MAIRDRISTLGARVLGLFTWLSVGEVTSTDLPMTAAMSTDKVPQSDFEIVQPFGFKAVPKEGALALTAGVGDDAVAVHVVDFRYEPDDVSEGESCMYEAGGNRLDMKAAGAEVNTTFDATGFKAGGVDGVSGTLTITIAAPAPVGVATIKIEGGIITSVSGSGNCPWVPIP